jgi:Transposase DDE domain group 1
VRVCGVHLLGALVRGAGWVAVTGVRHAAGPDGEERPCSGRLRGNHTVVTSRTGALFAMQDTPWDRALKVTADGDGLVGHAGAVLLRKIADRSGLTGWLGPALARAGKSPAVDRGMALVSMAVAIALGAASMNDIAVLAHQEPVFGPAPSDTTVRRTLELADERSLGKVAKVRAKARAHVWGLVAATPAGFPWLEFAGKTLKGWLVIDMDATLVTAHSEKQGAAPTFKKGYGFHPLGAWLASTAESLAMLLRPGNAGSNTVSDHIQVLAAAITQIPARMRSRLLLRVDGAGASHELITHLLSLATARRTVLFTCGWMITAADEDAIRKLPASAWQADPGQDGAVQDDKHVTEITHLMSRAAGWPAGLRWIVRRTKPSRRQMKNLTACEKATGWRYSITCTNIPATGISGVPGSHHPQFIDVAHREHAVVEDRVRTSKAMGLRNLPSKTWQVNCGWVLAANIAADLAAWSGLLGLYDCDDLKDAEPDTLRLVNRTHLSSRRSQAHQRAMPGVWACPASVWQVTEVPARRWKPRKADMQRHATCQPSPRCCSWPLPGSGPSLAGRPLTC